MDLNSGERDPELAKQAELNALALLTGAHQGDLGGVFGAILRDANVADGNAAQNVANQVDQLTNVIEGLIVIAHTLLSRCAAEMKVEPEELLDALGRMVSKRHENS